METPAIRTVVTRDGTHLPYWAIGGGPVLLHLPMGAASHIEAEWHNPELRSWYERLAESHTVVRLDPRGQGLNDAPTDALVFEDWLRDMDELVDALGADTVRLLGVWGSGSTAIGYAVRRPERVTHLVLCSTVADFGALYGDPQLATLGRLREAKPDPLVYAESLARLLIGWSSGAEAHGYAAVLSATGDPESLGRVISAVAATDTAGLLPAIRSHTLVLHRRDVRVPAVEAVHRLAARIPGSNLVILDGESALPAYGDLDAAAGEIERFLDGPGTRRSRRSGQVAAPPLRLVDNAARTEDALERLLSERETEVLRLLAQGYSNARIAQALVVSPATVARHVHNILSKTGLENRTQLASFAHRIGLAG